MTDPVVQRVKVEPKDPTEATTAFVLRIAAQHERLVEEQLARVVAEGHGSVLEASALRQGILERFNERLSAMDKAADILATDLRKVPSDLQVAITSVNQLHDVKFQSLTEALSVLRAELTSRFDVLDKQTVREKAAADLAVNAAFAAADKVGVAAAVASDKAIDKSERATAETIKTNESARVAGNQALSDKIEDDRSRMGRMEQQIITLQTQRVTGHEDRTELKSSTMIAIAAGGLILTLVVAIATIWISTGGR